MRFCLLSEEKGQQSVERKGFDAALAAATSGVVGTLIVWKLDRLSRRGIGQVGKVLDDIEKAGGRLADARRPHLARGMGGRDERRPAGSPVARCGPGRGEQGSARSADHPLATHPDPLGEAGGHRHSHVIRRPWVDGKLEA
ncbi:resolvase domain-containing protein [Streptomyces venezuelae]|nr:resolvase domain-containing protein [Streptomyces venezuelae]QPK46671.1 recombinase family protein [Streptomyces gardneri]CUM39989.1 hypothetical protein BN2537_8943 [Streptomyces venezuelae]